MAAFMTQPSGVKPSKIAVLWSVLVQAGFVNGEDAAAAGIFSEIEGVNRNYAANVTDNQAQ